MKIHHLNCGTMCPVGGNLLMYPREKEPVRRRLVCHCLLIETNSAGLVLVDTGIGLRDVVRPARISLMFRLMNRIQLREEETALRQIEALGYSAADVRHIVLTHLDFDHAGGLEDFPEARVHLLAAERRAAEAAARSGGFIGRRRYRRNQWNDVAAWAEYEAEGETWFGFGSVRDLNGLPPEILMIPLPGHTTGHAGIAVAQGDRWLLHAGDAYFNAGEIRSGDHSPPGQRLYQRMMDTDRLERFRNQDRLRALATTASDEVRIICSHDAGELCSCRETAAAGAHAGAGR